MRENEKGEGGRRKEKLKEKGKRGKMERTKNRK